MLDSFPLRGNEPEVREQLVSFVGGTAAVTKVTGGGSSTAGGGTGVTVTYVSTGIVDLTWNDSQGTFLQFQGTFQATTASALKGYTVVPGVYNATTRTLRLNITNAADTLADLAALQWLNCRITFKRLS